MGISTAVGLGIAGLAGVIGNLANASAEERAALLREKGVQEWLKINIPDPAKQKLALERFVNVGQLTPELESAVNLANTEFEKVQVDPRAKESRLRALGALEDLGFGGETTEDAAALESSLIKSGARNRGAQEAVLGSMARRGQLGTGLELSARMEAAQNEGDRLASQGLDLEMQRRQRALNALMGAGDLAGDIQDDEYRMAADKAQAKDAISKFNAMNLQGVRGRNVDRNNTASQYNLDRAQDISNRNVGLSNFQQQYNKELDQQRFQNEATKAAGMSGQYGAQADDATRSGQNAAKMWGGIASGAGTLAASFQNKENKADLAKTDYAGDNFDYDEDRDRWA